MRMAGPHHALRGDWGARVAGGRGAGLGISLVVVDVLCQPVEGALQVKGLLCNPRSKLGVSVSPRTPVKTGPVLKGS